MALLSWTLAALAYLRFADHYAQYSSGLEGQELQLANYWFGRERSVARNVGTDGTIIAVVYFVALSGMRRVAKVKPSM